MARMWRGPSGAVKAAEANPDWAKLHRHNAERGVFCNMDNDGRSASFYSISKQRGEYYQHDLGEVRGNDPMLTVLWGSHRFVGLDAELMRLHHNHLERLAEEIAHDGGSVVLKLGQAVDQFLS